MAVGLPTNPSGWPIREPGFFLGYIGHPFFVSIDRTVSESAMDVFLRELERSIDLRADEAIDAAAALQSYREVVTASLPGLAGDLE